MPEKSADLWRQLGAPGVLAHQRFANVDTLDVSGWRVAKGEGLFPKELKPSAISHQPSALTGANETAESQVGSAVF
jgi:hypothetical protein